MHAHRKHTHRAHRSPQPWFCHRLDLLHKVSLISDSSTDQSSYSHDDSLLTALVRSAPSPARLCPTHSFALHPPPNASAPPSRQLPQNLRSADSLQPCLLAADLNNINYRFTCSSSSTFTYQPFCAAAAIPPRYCRDPTSYPRTHVGCDAAYAAPVRTG